METLSNALAMVFGAFLSGLVGIAMFRYKRSRDAKDHLLATVSQLSGELCRSADPLAFYVATLPRMTEAVFRLRPVLRKRSAGDLSAFWNLYLKANELLQGADTID